MAERAKLRKRQIADILDQINRSEAWEKFAVGACVKVKRTHWGKKYSDNLPDHITSDFIYGKIAIRYLNKAHVTFFIDNASDKVSYEQLTLVTDSSEIQYGKSQKLIAQADVIHAVIQPVCDQPSSSQQASSKAPAQKASSKTPVRRRRRMVAKTPSSYAESDGSESDGSARERSPTPPVSRKATKKNKKQSKSNKPVLKVKMYKKKKEKKTVENVSVAPVNDSDSGEESTQESNESSNTESSEESSGGEEELDFQYYGIAKKDWDKLDAAQRKKLKIDMQEKAWPEKGWSKDPAGGSPDFAPSVRFTRNPCDEREIDFFLSFLPSNFIKEELIPATNASGLLPKLTYEEFLQFLGIIYSFQLTNTTEEKVLWMESDVGFYQAQNYGRFMPWQRYRAIKSHLRYSKAQEPIDQIEDFIAAFNTQVKLSYQAGSVLTIDESMWMAYFRKLVGRKKMPRKPTSTGNEIKNIADAKSLIVMHIELQRDPTVMDKKEYVDKYQPTTACTLRLAKPWRGSWRKVVADAWFGSVTTAMALYTDLKLFSTLMVKGSHKYFPKELLHESSLDKGAWQSYSGVLNGVPMMATLVHDLKYRNFVTTCFTDNQGEPRVRIRSNKKKELINRPEVAEKYSKYNGAIDHGNHYRQGRKSLEKMLKTKKPTMRQFCGVMSFIYTNSYLAWKYFGNHKKCSEWNVPSLQCHHTQFKVTLANQLIYIATTKLATRSFGLVEVPPVREAISGGCQLVHNGYYANGKARKLNCFHCYNKFDTPVRNQTYYKCLKCKKAYCLPTQGSTCWAQHLSLGAPEKKYRKNSSQKNIRRLSIESAMFIASS